MAHRSRTPRSPGLGPKPKCTEKGREPLPKTVGGPSGLRSVEQAAREYVAARRAASTARFQGTPEDAFDGDVSEDAAWTNLCVAVDGWKPGEAPKAAEAAPPSSDLEPLDTPWMVQDFKDLNTLHPFGDPARDAVLRIFMWCRRAEDALKARSARESSSGPSPSSSPEARPMKLRAKGHSGSIMLYWPGKKGETLSTWIDVPIECRDEIEYRINHFEAGEGSREGSKA